MSKRYRAAPGRSRISAHTVFYVVSSLAFSAAAEAQTAAPPAAPAPPAASAPAAAPTKGSAGTTATWWGHAAFVITTPGGATIAVDPWLENPRAPQGVAQPAALDVILVTHGHSDHVGNAVQLAKRTRAKVIASYELASALGIDTATGMNPGGSTKIKDATITLVEAVHSSGYGEDPKTTRYGGAPLGFVIAVDKGPTIYHAGDTDVFASMSLIAERYHPTVALLPIGGNFTMDPAGAALASKLLRVKTVVPMHFGTFPVLKGTVDELRAAIKHQRSAAKIVELKPGESTRL